jgi:serine/threonine protein kinase
MRGVADMKILPTRFRRGRNPDDVPKGRYKLRSMIGRGSAARVFRAYDNVFRREVAIKIYDLSSAGDLVVQERELRLLASLNHPGIVGLLDAGVDTSESDRPRAFLVMEVATLGRDLADALRYIHDRGIVHRDISPANVLLTQYGDGGDWHAKFGDFGIAVQATDAPVANDPTSGTAAYVSPEQVKGSAAGPASDIYSLGLVLLQCFTRTLAFPGVPEGQEDARISNDPAIPAELPFEWNALLAAMTSRDPVDRPGAQAVFDALHRIQEHRTGRHQHVAQSIAP